MPANQKFKARTLSSERVRASGAMSAPADEVATAVRAMVAYACEIGERPRSNGLSIFSPINTAFFEEGYYPNAVAVSQWEVPFGPGAGARAVTTSKLQHDLAAGDAVSLYTSFVDTDADSERAELGAPVTLAAAPAWKRAPVAGQKLCFLFAQDLKRQVTASPLHLVVDVLGDLGL